MYLTTEQAAQLTSVSPWQISQYVRDGDLKPAVRGGKNKSHQFNYRQVLALGVSQVLRKMGITGGPIRNVIRLIASHDSGAWDRTMESRPVLCVIPGVAIIAELVPREYVQARAAELLATLGTAPLGIDLDRMDVRMRECIQENEANGWETEPATEQTEATK